MKSIGWINTALVGWHETPPNGPGENIGLWIADDDENVSADIWRAVGWIFPNDHGGEIIATERPSKSARMGYVPAPPKPEPVETKRSVRQEIEALAERIHRLEQETTLQRQHWGVPTVRREPRPMTFWDHAFISAYFADSDVHRFDDRVKDAINIADQLTEARFSHPATAEPPAVDQE